jgi:transposase
MNANMLFTWRRAADVLSSGASESTVTFVPAAITAEPITALSPATPAPAGRMEIVLACGDRVMVGSDVDTTALARVIKVLSRR